MLSKLRTLLSPLLSFLSPKKTAPLGILTQQPALYQLALTHASACSHVAIENNERLEFLGDAVLGTVVAAYLYRHHPTEQEGILTELRSQLVNRQQLNRVAIELGFRDFTIYNKSDKTLLRSDIFGNTLESFIGAIFIDKGYPFCKQWVEQKIIPRCQTVNKAPSEVYSSKNVLCAWANKNKKKLEYTFSERTNTLQFKSSVYIDHQMIAQASGSSKKEASKIAAMEAIRVLEITRNV